MKKIRNQNGVTLVALVVTIIVLIILAGISINLTLGDNGIITIAKRAKENTELAKVQEEKELNELYTQLTSEDFNSGNLPYDSIAKLTEFKTSIANAIDEAGGIKPDTSAETSIFVNNIKGIVKEVTKDATATANDIVEGKTAWVNGECITGIGTGAYDFRNILSSTNKTKQNATSISNTIEIPSKTGILILVANLKNAVYSDINISMSNGGTATTLYSGTSLRNNEAITFFYKINGTINETISVKISHSNTGGGISILDLYYLY